MKGVKTKMTVIKILRYFALLSVFIFLGLPVYGDTDSESDMKKLEEGKPVVWFERDGDNKKAYGKILVNATVDKCWKAAADLDGFADWCPGMIYSRTVGKEGDNAICMFGGKVLVFTIHIPESLLLDEKNKTIVGQQLSGDDVAKYREMGWDLIEANYTNDYKEEYKLEAYGDKTIVYYTITLKLKYSVPKVCEDLFCKMTVPSVLKAAKKGFENYALEYCQQDKQMP